MDEITTARAPLAVPLHAVKSASPLQLAGILCLFGAAVYFPIAFGRLANPDVFLNGLTSYKSGLWEISLGRFGLPVYDRVRGGVIVPSFVTFVCIALMVACAMLLCRTLRTGRWQTLLIGAALLLSPTFMNTLTYYYCASPYLLAMLFATLAAVLLTAERNTGSDTAPDAAEAKLPWYRAKWWKPSLRALCAAALLAASLSLYQAYFFVAVSLCVVFALCALLDEAAQVKRVLALLALQAGVCLGALFVYSGANAAVQHAFGVAPETARFGGAFSLAELPKLLGAAYHNFFAYFFTDSLLNNTAYRRNLVNLAVFALLAAAFTVVICQKRLWRSVPRAVSIGVLLAALPVTCMGVTLAGVQYSLVNEATGVLTVPAMPLVYVLAVAAWGKIRFARAARPLRFAMPVCGAALVLMLVCYAGVFQNRMQTNAQRYTAAAQLVAQTLSAEYGNLTQQKVIFLGTLNGTSNFPDPHPELALPTQWTLANHGMVWDSLQGQIQGWPAFFREALGITLRGCTQEEFLAFAATGKAADMPLFPDEGSVVRWNDCIVVRMGHV